MFKSPKDRCDVIDKIIESRLKSMNDVQKNQFIQEKLRIIYLTSDDEYIIDDACEYVNESIAHHLDENSS